MLEDLFKESQLTKRAYINKDPDGYAVYSEKGKRLGGPYKTHDEAVKRLRQVEYFKRQK